MIHISSIVELRKSKFGSNILFCNLLEVFFFYFTDEYIDIVDVNSCDSKLSKSSKQAKMFPSPTDLSSHSTHNSGQIFFVFYLVHNSLHSKIMLSANR